VFGRSPLLTWADPSASRTSDVDHTPDFRVLQTNERNITALVRTTCSGSQRGGRRWTSYRLPREARQLPVHTRRARRRPSGPAVGLVLGHGQFATAQLTDQAQAAEQAGFRYLSASDHLQPWQDNEGHSMFPWITLALAGQRTNHITFGTWVTCPIYRYHPTIVAQAFASLAVLYPGRVFLGVGTGERLNEKAATTQFGPYRERHDRLVEAIQLIRQLWSGQRTSFQGHYFQTNQLKIYDLPASPPQIFVAAGGPKSAHLAGQYGDGWIAQANPLDKVLAGWTTGTDPAMHIAAVQAVLDTGAMPFIRFPQQNPLVTTTSTAPRSCRG
jgi:Luciferase-like monooxygenase